MTVDFIIRALDPGGQLSRVPGLRRVAPRVEDPDLVAVPELTAERTGAVGPRRELVAADWVS